MQTDGVDETRQRGNAKISWDTAYMGALVSGCRVSRVHLEVLVRPGKRMQGGESKETTYCYLGLDWASWGVVHPTYTCTGLRERGYGVNLPIRGHSLELHTN